MYHVLQTVRVQAPSAALEKFLAGHEVWASNAQSTLAASIDAHLGSLQICRNGCAVELGKMRTVMDQFEGVRHPWPASRHQ